MIVPPVEAAIDGGVRGMRGRRALPDIRYETRVDPTVARFRGNKRVSRAGDVSQAPATGPVLTEYAA